MELTTRPADFDVIARRIEDATFAEHAEHLGQVEVLIVMRYGSTSALPWLAKMLELRHCPPNGGQERAERRRDRGCVRR